MLPQIGIKITREDDWIKIKVGKYQLKLKQLDQKSQTYDFIALEQFITKTAQLLYSDIVKKEQEKKMIRDAFLGAKEDTQEQKLVEGLLKEKENGK